MLRRAALLVTIAWCSAPLAAQVLFAEMAREHTTRESNLDVAVDAGDLDGDGDPDLVFGLAGGVPRIYHNDGGAVFQVDSAGLPPTKVDCEALRLVDLDGDGDLDLVLAQSDKTALLYISDGKGSFIDETATRFQWDSTQIYVFGLVVSDLDGDGDCDLVFTGHHTLLYLNDGRGVFVQHTDPVLAQRTNGADAVAADFDGDGFPDLAIAGGTALQGQHYLYLNDGQGGFVDASSQLPAAGGRGESIAAGDVDGDHDLDLVVGGYDQGSVLYLNDGSGRFAAAPSTALPLPVVGETYTGAYGCSDLVDVDVDDDLDLVAASVGGGRYLLENDGGGHFRRAAADRLRQRRAKFYAQVCADLDGDGDVDIAEAVYSINPSKEQESGIDAILLNDGTGTFFDAAGYPIPQDDDTTTAALAADFTGDGYPDLVFATGSFYPHDEPSLRVLVNDRSFGFVEQDPAALSLGQESVVALAAGDVNADGHPDLFVGRDGTDDVLFLGDGTGALMPAPAGALPPNNSCTNDAVFVDVDGDADLDLVTAASAGSLGKAYNGLYLNDGTGVLTDASARLPGPPAASSVVVAIDVDRDGDSDLMFGNNGIVGDLDRLLINDGHGGFADETTQRLPSTNTYWTMDILWGDIDGDGFEDLVLCGSGTLLLYHNDGSGSFVDVTGKQGVHTPYLLTGQLSDVDGDGDLDLVEGTSRTGVLLNDGRGGFTEAMGAIPSWRNQYAAAAFGDFDGDGDLDLAQGNAGPSTLFWNQQHQLSAPLLARPGRSFELRARGSPLPSGPSIAAIALSTRTELPWPSVGVLRLEPSTAVLLGTVSWSAGGPAVWRTTLPRNASLQGFDFTVQALVIDSMARAALTNAITARIL